MKKENIVFDSLFLLLVMGVSFFLTYHQVFCSTETGKYASDTLQHIQFAKDYQKGAIYIPHPLWHLCTLYIADILHVSIETAAVLSSTIFLIVWSVLVLYVVKYFLNFKYEFYYILVALIILIIGPLNIPWYNPNIYFGQSSPNIWHNVTLWAVKPFALLTILFLFDALDKKNIKSYLLSALFLFLSIFAKPSFAIMFLPALFIYMLIKKLYRNKNFLIFFALASIASASILIYQYLHTFTASDSHIVFDFLGVWSISSNNIPMSIFLGLAFPILFTLSEVKILDDKYILLSWIQTFIALLLFSCLAQSGKYYGHGNFGWSYAIAMSLLYLFSIIKFFEMYSELTKIKRYSLLLLLVLQVAIGLYFFIQVAEGYRVLLISIKI